MSNAAMAGRRILKNAELAYLIKFISLMAVFYYFHVVYIGITDPGGKFYSGFLHEHLDYISWLRKSILHTADFIVHGFGLNPYISDAFTLRMADGPGVIIGFTCLGYGVMSFWGAFVLAQEDSWLQKLKWSLVGIVGIWFINCGRVAVLLVALHKQWQVNRYLDHHAMFNVAAYLLIIALIYLYYSKTRKTILDH